MNQLHGKQTWKGSGWLVWDSTSEGLNALYEPYSTKSAHGFFHLATLRGADFEKSLESVLKFKAEVDSDEFDNATDSMPFVLFLSSPDAPVRDGQRLKFFAGNGQRQISFVIPNHSLENPVDVHIRVLAQFRGRLRISKMNLIGCLNEAPVSRVPSLSTSSIPDTPLSLVSSWKQEGQRLSLNCLQESVFFDMPIGWNLDSVTSKQRDLVDDFIFGGLRSKFFGVQRLIDQDLPPAKADAGADGKTVLSFSTGEDSTASLAVLPENTPCYFCRRPYNYFFTHSGQPVELERRYAEEYALSLVPDCLIIDSDMELLTTKFGGKFGNPTTASVASIGALLAEYIGVTSVSIGAQLETSYLRNGQTYTDVSAVKSSVFRKYKNIFNYANLDICYPVGALSEVLTNHIVNASADRFFAVPCPHTGADLKPCGACYKCFRKIQMAGGSISSPNKKCLKILSKTPLKMATSAIYAARKGGYTHAVFEQYEGVELSFLERYYDYALETLVPQGLRQYIRQRYREYGFEPMTSDDDYRLRTIAKLLAPKLYRHDLAFPKVD